MNTRMIIFFISPLQTCVAPLRSQSKLRRDVLRTAPHRNSAEVGVRNTNCRSPAPSGPREGRLRASPVPDDGVSLVRLAILVESRCIRPFPVPRRLLAPWRTECRHRRDLEQSAIAPHPTRSGSVYLGAHLSNSILRHATKLPAVIRQM